MSYRRLRRTEPTGYYPRYATATTRRSVAAKMDRANFALAFVGAVLALKDYADSGVYKWERACKVLSVSENGKYAKVVRLLESGEPWGKPIWVNTYRYYRATDTMQEYILHRQIESMTRSRDAEVKAVENKNASDLSLLSQNTVTRALVHAYQNDYCSETAVALISAGHKMPDVTLEFEVTLAVSVTLDGNSNYYPLRELFGHTGGEVEGASGISAIESHEKVLELVANEIAEGDYNRWNMSPQHMGTSVDWGTPVLRQVSTYEASNQVG